MLFVKMALQCCWFVSTKNKYIKNKAIVWEVEFFETLSDISKSKLHVKAIIWQNGRLNFSLLFDEREKQQMLTAAKA
jgi:hypothetical protein